jgi:hypothetical protein
LSQSSLFKQERRGDSQSVIANRLARQQAFCNRRKMQGGNQRERVVTDLVYQGEGREGVDTAIHRASPSVLRASRGVRRSNCKQIWLRVHDPSEGMLKLLLYKILLV